MSFKIEYDGDGKVIGSDYKEPVLEEEHIEQVQEVLASEDTSDSLSQESTSVATEENNEYVRKVSQENAVSELEVLQTPAQETNKERNLRVLRESKEDAERETARIRRELEYERARREEAELRYVPKKQPEPEEELPYGADEQLYKKVREQERRFEQQEQELKRLKAKALEDRIYREFPDIDKVVNNESMAILKKIKPRLASIVDHQTDMYEAAALAYEFIKDNGCYEPEDTYMEKKQAVQRNLAKPKPVTSISAQRGDSPLHKANEYQQGNGFPSASEIARLRKEVNDASMQY